jgi:alkylation response protein AidB-like acyl-CoA dehydrogenase
MYLAAEGQELEIAEAAATFLADAMPMSRLQEEDSAGMSASLRASLAELGWFALAVPESAGGSGLSEVEHVLFFREVGRRCGPVDILAQCLAANAVTDADRRAEFVAGTKTVGLIVEDRSSFRVLGSEETNFGLHIRPEGSLLVAMDGQGAEFRSSLDHANAMGHLERLPSVIDSSIGDRIWLLGQLATSAMLIGVAEAALELIVEYAKIRETFGRKIGAWQAVRHPCAEMAVRVEAARAQLWYAATATKEGHADAGAHRDAAKYLANLAALTNADSNIQLHGGIGVTFEHNAHFFLKHALVLSRLFGTKRTLLAQLLHAQLKD